MAKRLTSIFLALGLLTLMLPPVWAQQNKTKPTATPASQEPGKKEKKSRFDKLRDKAKTVGKAAVNVATGKTKADPVALALGALFNDQLPLKLDASTAYKEAPVPDHFKPVSRKLTLKNLSSPVPSGDYTIQIRTICAKADAAAPGRGVGYRLAPLRGKQANALAALVMRGDIAHVPHKILQMMAWEIQASIPYGEMPKEHQAIVDGLIPEYKASLSGGFLQKLTDGYEKAVREHPQAPIAGFGETLRSLNRSRNIIREEAFNYQRSQQRLFDNSLGARVITPDVPEASLWSEIQPGVFAQIVIREGYEGINDLNIRVTPQAGKPKTNATLTTLPLLLGTAYTPAQWPLVFPTIAEILGLIEVSEAAVGSEIAIGTGARVATRQALRFGVRQGIIAYVMAAHAAQPVMISPNVGNDNGSGEDKPELKKWADGMKEKGKGKIPDDWGEGEPSDNDKGWKWKNPDNPRDEVRIMKGDPKSRYEHMREDYVQLRRDSQVIGRDGQPIRGGQNVRTGNSPDAHIPFREWTNWSTRFHP